MLELPLYVTIIFILTTFITLALFYRAIKKTLINSNGLNAESILILLLAWLLIQGVLSYMNVYRSNTNSLPPRIFLFGILPTIVIIISLFATKKGRQFIDALPLENLTYLNSVRVPVELVLYWLFINKVVPELMTFEGRNADILAGITAPFIAYYGFTINKLSRKILLVWNIICLGLLLNIVVNAFLSAPSPLQLFAFDQPNIAILMFPFVWLPTFIVPIVLFGHLTSIRQLVKKGNELS